MKSLLQNLVMLLSLSLIATTVLAARPNILVLGDSISAAYGINTDQGWVALLQKQLDDHGYVYHVINASVSGDTTRTGLNRLPDALAQYQPEIVIVELGGNDGLRGLPFDEIENSLNKIIDLSHSQQAQVLLVAVRLPPNYGKAYTSRFADLYLKVANENKVAAVPRLLDQVADHRELLQADGIHPTAQGQSQIMRNIWRGLKPMLVH